jgi:hypothetical protein
MSDPVTAAMIGAGVSGGTSLLRGKSLGSSLRNAAIGGALGGAGGYLGGAMGGAGNVGGAAKGGINFSSIGSGLGGTTGLPVGGQGINLGSLGYDATQGANLLGNLGTGITQTANPLLYLDDAANLTNPVTDSVFNRMGTSVMDTLKANPFQAAGFGMNVYDRMNPSQAPLQPSPMLSAQQLMGQQGAVPTPQFNSIPQLSRRPIYIG